MAYSHLEPFGEERADLRAAMIASLIANANRDSKKHPSPFTIDDFMLIRRAGEQSDPSAARTAHRTPLASRERFSAVKSMMLALAKAR